MKRRHVNVRAYVGGGTVAVGTGAAGGDRSRSPEALVDSAAVILTTNEGGSNSTAGLATDPRFIYIPCLSLLVCISPSNPLNVGRRRSILHIAGGFGAGVN